MRTFLGSDTRKKAWYYFYKHRLQQVEQTIRPRDVLRLTRRRHIYGVENPLETLGPFFHINDVCLPPNSQKPEIGRIGKELWNTWLN